MEVQLIKIAGLIGDPVRATVLWTLLDGKAYTATELAIYADTSLQNMSMHLNKLTKADLLTVERQGRHRYFRYSRNEVAYAIEGLTHLAPKGALKENNSGRALSDFQYCRTCYDHMAGKVGVLLTDYLLKTKIIRLNDNKLFSVTEKGEGFFEDLNIDVQKLKQRRRIFAKPCLDWSERKFHLAGALGAALLEKMLREDWVRRRRSSRVLMLTAKGQKEWFNKWPLAAKAYDNSCQS